MSTPASFSFSFENKGVLPNSVMLAKIGTFKFSENLNVPILANITEFGKTPLFSKEDLKEVGVDMILYPLSAFRAMSKAAEGVYSEILEKGTQQDLIDRMQTRDELYEVLDYHTFEKKLDDLFEE